MNNLKFPQSEKIDVTICTYNSEHKLVECIDSIIKYINLNNLIVVDGGSQDDTIEIVENFKSKINIQFYSKPKLNLGMSRSFAFSKVMTSLFLQIDSDVVLDSRAVEAFQKHWEDGDVVEFGIDNVFSFPYPPDKLHNNSSYFRRGFFFVNLINKNSVKEISLNVRTHEEDLLRRILVAKNKSWIKTKQIIGTHYSKPVRYKNRTNVGAVRIVPIGKKQYIDRGIVFRITNEKKSKIFKEVLIIISESFNVSCLINCLKGMSNPFTNIFYFLNSIYGQKK